MRAYLLIPLAFVGGCSALLSLNEANKDTPFVFPDSGGMGSDATLSDASVDSVVPLLDAGEDAPLGRGTTPLVVSPGAPTVINGYARLLEDAAVGSKRLRAESLAGIKAGSLLMVWQVGGASPSRGATFLLGAGVGRYELVRVSEVFADGVGLVSPLSRDYAGNATQVIYVPEYTNVTVQAGATLTAQAWDGRKGGIVAFIANQAVTNDGLISATGKGFRGAPELQDPLVNGNCSEDNGAAPLDGQKGEGVATGSFAPNIGARANIANAGGGGNCHNAGGGGGGHGGAGGRGGRSYAANVGGEGGGSTTYLATERLLLGGGGGAGHKNDQVGDSSGGRGGGVVFARALSFEGKGRIEADGVKAADVLDDGAGGGGAGGLILVQSATTASCAADAGWFARGSKGGNMGYDADVIGPGGGGGGGWIVVQATGVACSRFVSAGPAGLCSSAPPSCGALPGSDGVSTVIDGGYAQ